MKVQVKKREVGIVEQFVDQCGIIRCISRNERVLFNVKALLEDPKLISIGDYVEYQTMINKSNSQLTAHNLIKLNPSSFNIESSCDIMEGYIHSLPQSRTNDTNSFTSNIGHIAYRAKFQTVFVQFDVSQIDLQDQQLTTGLKVRFILVKNKLTHASYAKYVQALIQSKLIYGVLFHCSELQGDTNQFNIGSNVECNLQYTGRHVATQIRLLKDGLNVNCECQRHIGQILEVQRSYYLPMVHSNDEINKSVPYISKYGKSVALQFDKQTVASVDINDLHDGVTVESLPMITEEKKS
ncbi:hypothetical protein GJ496_009213 [Pomphorhynchus laevis]|nr:hypothetical protein GJ496_009213 [Pomphorhynchus laevis]